MAEQRRQKERDAEDFQAWQQVVQKNAEDHERNEAAKKRRQAEITQDLKRQAAESEAAVVRRREREVQQREREKEELDRVIAADKRAEGREAQAKAEVAAKKSKAARASFEAAAIEREARKKAEIEEGKALAAELKKQSELREAEANAGYKKRQAVVDRRTSTLGVANAAVLAQKEMAEDTRITQAFERQKKQVVEDYWKEDEARQRMENAALAVNATLAGEVRATRGVAEREADQKQGELFRKQDAEFLEAERRKFEKARKTRDSIDSELMRIAHTNASIHRDESNVTDRVREREMSYNRHTMERMASEGFLPHASQPLLLKAKQLKMTIRAPQAARA